MAILSEPVLLSHLCDLWIDIDFFLIKNIDLTLLVEFGLYCFEVVSIT
jgi:hypothetical protein